MLLLLVAPVAARADGFLGSASQPFGPNGPGAGLFPDAPTTLSPRPVNPVSLAADGTGHLYALQGTHVWRFDAAGAVVNSWDAASNGIERLAGGAPQQRIAADRSGAIYIADSVHGRVVKFSGSGEVLTSFSGLGEGGALEKGCPVGVAVDARGNIYASCAGWVKLSPAGAQLARVSANMNGPIAAAPDGTVYATTPPDNVSRVLQWAPDGTFVKTIGSPRLLGGNSLRAEEGELGPYQPKGSHGAFGGAAGLTVDPAGTLWVADPDSERIQGFKADGKVAAVCYPRELGRIDNVAAAGPREFYATDDGRIQRFGETADPKAICDSRWRQLALPSKRLRLTHQRVIRLRIGCNAAIDNCQGNVKMTTRIRRRGGGRVTVRLGQHRFSVEPEKVNLVSIRVGRSIAARVRRAHPIKVRLTAVGKTPDGNRYSTAATALLRFSHRK